MKKSWVSIVVVILVILVLGYMGRHRLRAMLGGSTPAPAPTQETTMAPASAMPSEASTSAITMTKSSIAKGNYLTDSKGMTLYMFDKDKPGVSNCTGSCLTTWPPFLQGTPVPASMSTGVTVFKKADGSMQYAYKGMPLYYYSKDKAVGDVTGDGVGGVWHLVKP